MWTKLLIIGVVSSLLAGMASCTKSDGPEPHMRNIYINLTDKTTKVQSFRMYMPAPGDEREPFLIQEELFIETRDTMEWDVNVPNHNPDSVFVIFNNERILKWYPNSREEKYSLYNENNYEFTNEPDNLFIYRFTETHWEMAEEMKTE